MFSEHLILGQNLASGSGTNFANYQTNHQFNPNFRGHHYDSGFEHAGNDGKYLHGVRGGRVVKNQGGRGGFPTRGRGGYQQGATNSNQGYNCLFCQIDSHYTTDCRKMKTARDNFHRGGNRSGYRGASRDGTRGGIQDRAFLASSDVKMESHNDEEGATGAL